MTLGDGGVVWTSLASRELGGATLDLNSAEASRSSWRESEVLLRVGLSKISIKKPATLFRPVFFLLINQRLKGAGTMSTAAYQTDIMYHSTKPIL
jgi:hypothetical protein